MKTTKKYGKKAELALSVWVKLARAYSTVNHLSSDNIRSYNLTPPQFGALECLGHLGPMTLGNLTRKHLVSGGNTTVVIDNLEKIGYVERIPNPADRRSIRVQLTSKGKKVFDEIFPQHARFIAEKISILTEPEQKQLGILLKKLGLGLIE